MPIGSVVMCRVHFNGKYPRVERAIYFETAGTAVIGLCRGKVFGKFHGKVVGQFSRKSD